MPRLDRFPQLNRNNLLMLPVQVNDTTPFTVPAAPLAGCRLAIVTTAGLHRRADRPFDPADQSYRMIPADTPSADILQSHTSLGFDRTPIMRDLNITFPIDRILELIERGELGGRAPNDAESGDQPPAPAQASRTQIARLAHSFFSDLPASAKRNWHERLQSFCSTTKTL